MSGRFAGSKSLDDRRRRRIAADETQSPSATGTKSPADPEKPLPTRRPTGRFPLRRIISRSPWKLAGVALMALVVCATALVAGHSKAIADGTYGPGLASLLSAESGRMTTTLGGLLLLVCGQFAWLIRWARSRSLRDFRGRYRVWWWASLALTLGGFSLLTGAHVALASTVVWLTDRKPFGSDMLFQLLPVMVANVLLLPSLQNDMRNCRTSRVFILTAALLWISSGLSRFFPEAIATAVKSLEQPVPVPAVTTGLFLLGAVSLFTALLFHARYVVYESVEPPEQPRRRKKVAKEAKPIAEPASKPQRASRRAAKAESKAGDAPANNSASKSEATAKPAATPAAASKSLAPVSSPAPKPSVAASEPAPPKPSPQMEDDWADEDGDRSQNKGRQYRRDEAHDSLKGLSKRERRKQRKLQRDAERAGLS